MSFSLEVRKTLGRFTYEAAVEADRDLLVLFGHSGAGKSLTLQFAAGVMTPDSGHIEIDGVTVFDSKAGVNVPPQRRNVGYVVQELALFPHMSVARNVAFGMSGAGRDERVAALLKQFGLADFGARKPLTLSGGQQQRVALARALGREGRLLLLDEPFSALDETLRMGLRRELIRLKEQLGLTVVFVTHDLREAHLLADRLAVFDEGNVLQVGKRDEVFSRPSSRRVGELLGVANIWRGLVASTGPGFARVEAGGMILTCETSSPFEPGTPVDVMIRAERINLRREGAEVAHGNVLGGRIVEEFALGSAHLLHFEAEGPGPALQVEIPARPYEVLGVGAVKRWVLELPPQNIHVVPAS